MKKLFFIAIISLIEVGACQAMTERQVAPAPLYRPDGCEICGQIGGGLTYFFPGPHGEVVHLTCYNSVKVAFGAAYKRLDKAFPEDPRLGFRWFNKAHKKFIKRVQEQVGEKTILKYALQEGLDKLKELFDTNSRSAILEILPSRIGFEVAEETF